MKKIIYTIFIFLFFLYCGPKQQQVERHIEDGVEVVVNHMEPYRMKGEPTSLTIEEEFTIDPA